MRKTMNQKLLRHKRSLSFSLTADEARVLEDLLLLLLLAPQVGEGVNDHTEDQVEYDNDDDEEEEEVVDDAGGEEGLRVGGVAEDVADAAAVPEAVVQGRHDAHEERVAGTLLLLGLGSFCTEKEKMGQIIYHGEKRPSFLPEVEYAGNHTLLRHSL